MVIKEEIDDKMKEDYPRDRKGHRFCFGEAYTLCYQQVSVKDICKRTQIWILLVPLLDVLLLNISIIVCYVVDASNHSIPPHPFIPAISQLGSKPPGSYIFTFGMTASSLTTFLLAFFRHKQVSFSRDDCSNTISVTAGYLTALSKILVGAFRYHPRFRWFHYSAFISYIFFSYVYIVTQVFLTYYTKTALSTVVLLIRLIIPMLMVVFGVLFCIIKLPRFENLNQPPYNIAHLAQWIYWSLLNVYTLTFMIDFTKIRVSWNILMSPYVQRKSTEELKSREEHFHKLYCAESDTSSRNQVLIELFESDSICETRV